MNPTDQRHPEFLYKFLFTALVPKDTGIGTEVVTVDAEDPDSNSQPIQYSFEEESQYFAINPVTGAILTKDLTDVSTKVNSCTKNVMSNLSELKFVLFLSSLLPLPIFWRSDKRLDTGEV